MIFCPTVSTGAFVARRNGKVFVTGNSGFPKSLDISKAIDKANGKHDRDLQPFGDYVKTCRLAKGLTLGKLDEAMGTNTAASWWEGRKSGIQPPGLEQYNRLKTVLEMDNRFDELIDWIEAEREVVGKAYRLDKKEGHVNYGGGTPEGEYDITTPSTEHAKTWDGYGTALKPAHEPICVAMKPLSGTYAQNAIEHGVAGINVDGCRVGTEGGDYDHAVGNVKPHDGFEGKSFKMPAKQMTPPNQLGRWPANIILSYPDDSYKLRDDVTGEELRLLAEWMDANAKL